MSSIDDTPTPGRQALESMEQLKKEVVFKTPLVPVGKKRKKQKVLDEDSYVEQLGKIIQRDFFPDLEKLQVQNEYLDAVEKNDVIKIRELHLKYSEGKTPINRLPSPATFETPANIHNSQGGETEEIHSVETQGVREEKQISLDQYLNSHTSEDNQSFEEMMEEAERRHRAKYSYLYQGEELSALEQKKLLALPSISEQAALPEKKLNIDTWGYKNKNYIMFVPDGVALTPDEELEMNKKRKEIVHLNTRLAINPFNESQSKETITELAKQQSRILDGKIGVDGKELITATPKINGFAVIRSPSPAPGMPGVPQSPLMTWGEVEGTPFRLDGSDTPLPRNRGPSFKMNEPPKREQLAHALAEKASERHRDKKRKAMDVARRHLASPSPRPNSSNIDRLAAMSPAAKLLATARLKLGGTDIRTPRIRTPVTPLRVTTPKLNLGIRKSDNLTDDLLKIEVPKRQRASDFF